MNHKHFAGIFALAFVFALTACGESSPGGAVDDPANNTPGADPNPDPNPAPIVDPDPNPTPGNPDPTPDPTADPDPNPEPDPEPGVLTYYKDIKPLLDRNCNGCHAPGGVGPFQLTTYAQVQPMAQAIKVSVESGEMPPWLPEEECRTFKGHRKLADAEIERIAQWIDEGTVEGDPADDPGLVPADVSLPNPDLVLTAASPYTPDPARPDDYRCLVLDHDFDRDTYVSAYQVVPDKRAIVHHVLFYLVPPAESGRLADLEDDDPAPGYECFGGPRAGNLLGTVAGWVPGSAATRYPAGAAYRIPAGSKVVMQIHYNLLAGPSEPDRTEIHMKLHEGTPQNLITIIPVPVPNLDIPAGEPAARHNATYPNPFGKDFTIVGTAPHMHMLGSEIRAHITHANGDRDCVVEVDDWDFNWQQFYEYEDDDFITLGSGDTVSLECVYDNSASNQPVVNGEQIEPRDVEWGEGSLDEMCLLYLTAMEPNDGVDTCGNFDGCNDDCGADDGACTLSCMSNGGGDCRQCAVFGLGECAGDYCGSESNAMLPCLLSCLQAPDVGECFSNNCPAQFDALWSCLGPRFYGGDCNNQIAECGLSQ